MSQSVMSPSASLAAIRDQILERNDLSWDDRRKLASSLKCFAEFAGQPLEVIPAQVPVVRDMFENLSASRFGRSEDYFANMKCQVWKAMRLQGIPVLSGRCKTELPPSWSALVDPLPPGPRRPLLPFIRFCIERGLEPDQVQQATFEAFEATLEQYSTRENRRKKFLAVCKTWNEQADHEPPWPQFRVSTPHRHNRYAVKKELLPATFHDDVERMLAGTQKVDLLAKRPRKTLRPTTVKVLRYSVYRLASACIRAGVKPQQIATLAALLEPVVVDLGLQFLLGRANGRKKADHYKIATAMHAIARDYVRFETDKLDQLCVIRNNVRRDEFGVSVIQSEMADKNRNTLRCFEDEQLVAAFLGLPDKILRRHRRLRVKLRLDAVRLQYALMVELLTFAPIRSCNLATIRLDRNLVTVGHGPNSRLHLVFSAHEVKNKRGLEFPLPQSTVTLLNVYLREARPILVRGDPFNMYHFPGTCDGHKQSAHMSTQLARLLFQEVGVRLTAHQFRHLAGFLYLEQNPGGYEVVRQLLGHRSISTTMAFYACMEQPKAVRIYDAFIERRREELLGLRHGAQE